MLKYQDLTTEIQRIWSTNTKLIPVIMGATRKITKSFIKYLRNITGKLEIKAPQKAIVGNAHIQRKVQSNLGSRTPRIMKNSVYEQIFRTQSVSYYVLCLELRTRKPSTSWSDKLGVSASAVFVEEWSSGKNPESATKIGDKAWLQVTYRTMNSAWRKLSPERVAGKDFEGFLLLSMILCL